MDSHSALGLGGGGGGGHDHHGAHDGHWGYAGGPPPTAMLRAPVKRPMSESDDGDDLYSDSSKDKCSSPSNSNSCQMLSRKKRRGVIEKKRRDRINTSLSELKRLVPSAFEKQGSAKLEKAEILQLTVDHLKMIQAKGFDTLSYEPHKYAMDYHGMGYRECTAEVSRYLERIEGLDGQNPLRLRLVAHLQTCVAQRDREKAIVAPIVAPSPAAVAPTAAPTATSWPPYVGGGATAPSVPLPVPISSSSGQTHDTHAHTIAPPPPPHYTELQAYHHHPHHPHHPHHGHHTNHVYHHHQYSMASAAQAHTHHTAATTATASASASAATFDVGQHYAQAHVPHGGAHAHNAAAGAAGAAMKPYRPWGAEVAY